MESNLVAWKWSPRALQMYRQDYDIRFFCLQSPQLFCSSSLFSSSDHYASRTILSMPLSCCSSSSSPPLTRERKLDERSFLDGKFIRWPRIQRPSSHGREQRAQTAGAAPEGAPSLSTTGTNEDIREESDEADEWQGDSHDEPSLAASISEAGRPHETSGKELKIVASIAAVILLGVTNRVLYKLALVPMGPFTFFLAQFQTFGYMAFYFSLLAARRLSGKVTVSMMTIPKRFTGRFLGIGFVEAVSSLLSFIGATKLPGVMLPVLGQSIIFWQVLLATFVLGKRLDASQLSGVGLVAGGVILAAWPSGNAMASSGGSNVAGGLSMAGIDLRYAALFVFASLFPAIDTIIKEKVFKDSKSLLDGKDLDLFVVNSFGSASQALFVFLLLPALMLARGMSLLELPTYIQSGWQCFQGITPACGGDCSGAPLLPLM